MELEIPALGILRLVTNDWFRWNYEPLQFLRGTVPVWFVLTPFVQPEDRRDCETMICTLTKGGCRRYPVRTVEYRRQRTVGEHYRATPRYIGDFSVRKPQLITLKIQKLFRELRKTYNGPHEASTVPGRKGMGIVFALHLAQWPADVSEFAWSVARYIRDCWPASTGWPGPPTSPPGSRSWWSSWGSRTWPTPWP